MRILIVLGNAVLAGIILAAGSFYPTLKEWSFISAGVVTFFVFWELIVAWCNILDAAKIIAWVANVFATFAIIMLLLPYKLGVADWAAIVALAIAGCALLFNTIAIIVYRSHAGQRVC